jgi:hypothetical protein
MVLSAFPTGLVKLTGREVNRSLEKKEWAEAWRAGGSSTVVLLIAGGGASSTSMVSRSAPDPEGVEARTGGSGASTQGGAGMGGTRGGGTLGGAKTRGAGGAGGGGKAEDGIL